MRMQDDPLSNRLESCSSHNPLRSYDHSNYFAARPARFNVGPDARKVKDTEAETKYLPSNHAFVPRRITLWHHHDILIYSSGNQSMQKE